MKPANPVKVSRFVQSRQLNPLANPMARILLRAVASLAIVGLLAGSFYLTSSASSADIETSGLDSIIQSGAGETVNKYSPLLALNSADSLGWSSALLAPFAMPQFGPPTVATFAGDCSTPKTVFNVQDTDKTVCARIENASPGWRVIWSNANFIADQINTLTSATQDVTLTLTTSSNLGDWRVILFEPLGGTVRVLTLFTAIDADNPLADLLINKTAASNQAVSGSQVVFTMQVSNQGPSSAADVQITDDVPANTTFVSFAQITGPVFSCTSPMAGSSGTTNCSIATFARGETATFIATYLVDSGATAGTEILNTANISSSTPDRIVPFADNNTTSAAAKVTTSAPCVLTCPSNITQSADAGQAGAIVTYSTPSSTGDCGQPTTGEAGETVPPISCNPGSGSFFGVGTTTVICAGQTGGTCTFQVTIDNPGALSISLNGADPFALECGSDFEDPGATAVNGTGNPVEVTVSGTVDNHTPGSYVLTYTAAEGENSASTTRTVNVSDNEAPVITIAGSNPLTLSCGQPFVDPGVSADDACEGAKSVNTSGTVDSNSPGTYTITYTATDSLNHMSTATRTVIVEAGGGTSPPIITLNGDAQITIECGTGFTDPGAMATAGCGGSVPVVTTGTVDSQTPGTYTITYTACVEDSPGHCDPALTSQIERTVTVEDTTAPAIILNGNNPLEVECHSAFTDPGATANDACAGSFAATASGTVDTNTVGSYTITYNAVDPSGHAATPVTRTVNVVDTTSPSITFHSLTIFFNNWTIVFNENTVTINGQTYPFNGVSFTHNDHTFTFNGETVTIDDNTFTLDGKTLVLWTPTHQYQTVNVTDLIASATDGCDSGVGLDDVVITEVTSDEVQNNPTNSDGNTINDVVIAADCKSVQLRAERDNQGNGRVYTVSSSVRDAAGNTKTVTSKIKVRRFLQPAVDSGPQYTVTGSCP